jgi:hypothetical protein
MVHKQIVRLCICLVLVLLVGVATSGSSAEKSPGTKAGTMCGGIAGLQCPAGEACKFPVNQCNVADLSGTCVKVPSTCPTGGTKVCGCDNKTYANECELLKSGVHQRHRGACKAAA